MYTLCCYHSVKLIQDAFNINIIVQLIRIMINLRGTWYTFYFFYIFNILNLEKIISHE